MKFLAFLLAWLCWVNVALAQPLTPSQAYQYSPSQAASDLASIFIPGSCVGSGCTLTAPNYIMPNGGYLEHSIFTASAQTIINGTTPASLYSTSGVGSQTVPVAGLFAGASFELKVEGIAATGALNTASYTETVVIGGVTIVTATTIALPVSLAKIPFTVLETCTVFAAGAGGSISCTGGFQYSTGLVSIAPLYTALMPTGPVSVAMSVPVKFDIQGSFSSTTGSPSVTVNNASIREVN